MLSIVMNWISSSICIALDLFWLIELLEVVEWPALINWFNEINNLLTVYGPIEHLFTNIYYSNQIMLDVIEAR